MDGIYVVLFSYPKAHYWASALEDGDRRLLTNKAKTDTSSSRKKILQYELSKELSRQAQQRSERQLIQARIKNLTESIPGLDLYEREKATQELKKLNGELASFPDIQDNAQKIRLQLEALNAKPLPIENEPIKLSGYINCLKL